MIDYARPYDQSMCDFLLPPTPPAPTRLEDFQVFKKGNPTYIYGNYYNNYDMFTEQEIDSTANVYHNLVSSREIRQEDWKYKSVVEWSPDDTTYWIIDCAMTQGFSEYEVPFYNFKVSGMELRHMRREEIFQRMVHPNVETNQSRRIADVIYDKLHARINEEMLRPTPLFRYTESEPYPSHEPVQTVLDLDSLDHKNRLYGSDYKPNDISLLHAADSSDDAEDVFRSSETASPECSYGSDGSKSGDEEEKRKMFKRPPGRPKGTGRKVCKRPRSVSVPEFLRNLLLDERYCPSIIKWEDHPQGKFRYVFYMYFIVRNIK